MLELIVLGALAQVQTVRLPPVTPPPAPSPRVEDVPAPVELTGFPDLAIGGIRLVNGDPSFEIRNQGGAATTQPVMVRACVYNDEGSTKRTCSRDESAGTLAAGESRWVAVNCFLVGGRTTYAQGMFGSSGVPTGSTAEQCVPARALGPAWKFRAFVDTPPDSGYAPTGSDRRVAPAALQPDCTTDRGCIRETDERNNLKDFVAPFGGERG
jgi:hypothetical protein